MNKIIKIICTDKAGKVTIVVLPEPITKATYYALKFKFKDYGTTRLVFQK